MVSRSRRVFLATTAAAVGVLAGCQQPGPESSTPTDFAVESVHAAAYRSVPHSPREFLPDTEPEPFAGVGVGDPEARGDPPHCVWVWNATSDRRQLSVSAATSGAQVFDWTWTFAPASCVGVVLFAPATYEFDVSGDDWTETVSVDRENFDCNASLTDLAVVGRGELERGGVTQEMGCG
jgi:hypothetical protein